MSISIAAGVDDFPCFIAFVLLEEDLMTSATWLANPSL